MDKIIFEDFGAIVPMHIGDLMLDNITQQRLVQAAQAIEYLKDPNDVEVWEALMVVIPYFSLPEQIKELAHYQADAEWVNIVMAKHAQY